MNEKEEKRGKTGGCEGGMSTLVMSAFVKRSSPSRGRTTGQAGFWVLGSMRVSCGGRMMTMMKEEGG